MRQTHRHKVRFFRIAYEKNAQGRARSAGFDSVARRNSFRYLFAALPERKV